MAAISALFVKVGRITFLVCSLILGGFVVLGQDFIRIWAGDGYGESYWIALAVMVPMTVDLIQNLGLTIMQVEDKYYFRGVVYFILALANAALSILLVPRFGIVSAAVSTGLCMLAGNGLVMNWYYASRVGLDIGLFWRQISSLAVPFLAATALTWALYHALLVQHGGVPLFLVGGVVYLCAYAFFVGCWGLNEYERGQVRAIARKFHLAR